MAIFFARERAIDVYSTDARHGGAVHQRVLVLFLSVGQHLTNRAERSRMKVSPQRQTHKPQGDAWNPKLKKCNTQTQHNFSLLPAPRVGILFRKNIRFGQIVAILIAAQRTFNAKTFLPSTRRCAQTFLPPTPITRSTIVN